MPKRFLVVTKAPTGTIELHRMKDWLRQHPEQIPPGLSADYSGSSSLMLCNGLKKRGWTVSETDQEVRLLAPDLAADEASIAVLGEPSEEAMELDPEEQFEFALESHLRDFIACNLPTIPIADRQLSLFVDQANRKGIEYPTDVGPVDILAVDKNGNFVVFELKLSRGPDKAMGQLLRYMGWVMKNLAGEHQVYGVVVAKNMDEKLKYASLPVPNVSLLKYEVDFSLHAAGLE